MFLLWLWRKDESHPEPVDKSSTYQFAHIFNDQVHASELKECYKQLGSKLANGWPSFKQKYEKERLKLKKSEGSWNYNDGSIIKNCIKKSMASESMSVLSATWCQHLNMKLLQGEDHSTKSVQEIMKREILIFCSSIFRYAFRLFERLFMKCYKKIEKGEQNCESEKVKEYYRVICQDLIRNLLTESEQFNLLYNQSLLPVLCRKYTKVDGKSKELQFQRYLKEEFQMEEPYVEVYKQAAKAIWQFHTESGLISKTLRSAEIIAAIERDHVFYFQSRGLATPDKKETITTKLLSYLFSLYCPLLQGSIKYLKLMICYRSQENQTPKQQKLLSQFCLMWAHQKTNGHLNVILDTFDDKS